MVTARLFRRVCLPFAEIEKRGLLGGMFAQFCHLVDAADGGLLLLSLTSALRFVPLSLLARVFLLALGKC